MATDVERILFVFGKYPTLGRVKTRLAPAIGHAAARRLYEAFLADVACRFSVTRNEPPFVVKWVYTPKASAFPQLIMSMQASCVGVDQDRIVSDATSFVGLDIEDIGTLQEHQLDWARAHGYDLAVIVGTDTPHLSSRTIADAFAGLASQDLVVGLSTDGGYYLLGVNKCWDILVGIDMTTDHVVDDIARKASVAGKTIGFVETMTDIDDWGDLTSLIKLLSESNGRPCPATWAALRELGLVTSEQPARTAP